MVRRTLFFLVIAASAFFALTHRAELASIVAATRGAAPGWLGLALALQFGYYACYALTYRQAFAAMGVRRSWSHLVPVILASMFVNTVTPSAGTAGPALIVDDAAREGHPVGSSTAATLFAQFVDFSGFAVVMFGGFTYLALVGRLTTAEIVAAVLFLAILIGMATVLFVSARSPRSLFRFLSVFERLLVRLFTWMRRPAPHAWADEVSREASAAVSSISTRKRTAFASWLVAVGGHALDLASFIAIGYAFGWREPAALAAGYAVGVVVWLVSLVPQGIGLVEASVALVLVSFGASTAQAAAISLTFRGLTFWLPVALGFLVFPRVGGDRARGSVVSAEFAARAGAVFVFGVGVIDVLSALTPALRHRLILLERFLPFSVTVGNLAATLSGLALIMLARGLWHHKRTAYLLTVTLLAASAASHLVKGLDYEEAAVALAVLIWLLAERRAFYARADYPSIRQGVYVALMAFASTLVYGSIGFWLLDRHFSVNYSFPAAIRQTVVMFTQMHDPGLVPITGFGRYFAGSIYLVGAATFGYALLMLLRPVLVREPATPAQRHRARQVVERWAAGVLADTQLLPDKAFWFSDGGSMCSYGVSGEMAVVLGDPIGPQDDLLPALKEFDTTCRRNGWRPVYYQATERSEPVYREMGYQSLLIGGEAVVDVGQFSLAGKSRKSMRNRINRLTEEGYRFEMLPAPQSPATMRELQAVSDEWLALVSGSEKRFSMGWFDPHRLRSSDFAVVRSPRGRIVAFADMLSEYNIAQATIDLMRHSSDAPSGTMDLLFVKLFEWSREHGFESFNMGLSPLAGVGESKDDALSAKALRLLYQHGGVFYDFQGLYAYKSKFDPCWESRYLIYPDPASLWPALAAVTSLNSGENPIVGYVNGVLRRREPLPGDLPERAQDEA